MRNFRAVERGVLYRSGQMSTSGLQRVIKEYGIRSVISLRDARDPEQSPPDEVERTICRDLDVTFCRMTPLRWSMPDGSIPAAANVKKFLELVNDQHFPRPILVHCFAGVHRTGAFVAIYRMDIQGWTCDEAIREMLTVAEDKSSFERDQLDFLENYKPNSK